MTVPDGPYLQHQISGLHIRSFYKIQRLQKTKKSFLIHCTVHFYISLSPFLLRTKINTKITFDIDLDTIVSTGLTLSYCCYRKTNCELLPIKGAFWHLGEEPILVEGSKSDDIESVREKFIIEKNMRQ